MWRNEGTEAYIRETVELVRDLDSVLTTIKDNVVGIADLLKTFERNLMFDRKVSKRQDCVVHCVPPCTTQCLLLLLCRGGCWQ